jgi:hypothetical protein
VIIIYALAGDDTQCLPTHCLLHPLLLANGHGYFGEEEMMMDRC